MLFVFGQEAQRFTQPWASSFHSLVPHLWDKGSGEEEETKASRGPGVTGPGDRGNHHLLLVAMDSCGRGVGEAGTCPRGHKSCSSLGSVQISVSMRSRGTQQAMWLAPWLLRGTAPGPSPLELPGSPLPRAASPCLSLGIYYPASSGGRLLEPRH